MREMKESLEREIKKKKRKRGQAIETREKGTDSNIDSKPGTETEGQ